MGSPGCPLTIWHWQAGSEQAGREVGAEGVGTTEEFTNGTVKASGVFSTDSWQVVIARHLNKAGDKTKDPFRMGEEINFAVAIWDGSSNERAGLKAVSARPVRINISDKNHAETRG